MTIKILLLSANPKDTDNLRLSAEFRNIKESILRSKYRHEFEVIQGSAVRPQDIRRIMLDEAPHIVHISGHAGKEGIYLENNQGFSHYVNGKVLEELFSLFDSVCCVILNSCYSEIQARYLVNVVPFIIGMSQSINDKDAIYFSGGFYDAVASNRSIEDAFLFGVNSIKLRESKKKVKPRSIIVNDNKKNETVPVLVKGKITRNLPKVTPFIEDNRGVKSLTSSQEIIQNDRENNLFLVISLSIVATFIYIIFVYKSWLSPDDLFEMVPSFLITGLSIGIFCSTLPFNRLYRSTFFISAVAPFLSGTFFLLINSFINIANAGEYNSELRDQNNYIIYFSFFFFISILFGLVSICGCYLGKKIQKVIKKIVTDFYGKIKIQSTSVRTIRISELTTVFFSLLIIIVSITITIIN